MSGRAGKSSPTWASAGLDGPKSGGEEVVERAGDLGGDDGGIIKTFGVGPMGWIARLVRSACRRAAATFRPRRQRFGPGRFGSQAPAGGADTRASRASVHPRDLL